MILWRTNGNLRALWLSGRVLDSRPRGHEFEPHWRHCAVSVRNNISPSLVLVQPRKTSHFTTERLLMGRKESHQAIENVPLVSRCLRNVVFFQAPSMDVDGNNEGLVVENASFSCSAPGCK